MLTERSIKFIGLFTSFLIIGLLLGNRIIIAMGLIPLCYFLVGLMIVPPKEIKLINHDSISKVWVGDVITIKYQIKVDKGFGSFTLHQDLPPHFILIDGNNLKIFWKSWHPQSYLFSYQLKCTKRGTYNIPPVKWEANHILRFTPTKVGELGLEQKLEVRPKILNIRRIRGLPGIAYSPFPVIDQAKIGVATTDFREIRKYAYGDAIKNINWKATARSTSQDACPLTNEYEVEGKKSVWIFLDASKVIEVGTDIENALEYCLEAANGVLYYFIDRGYRVGLYIFNHSNQLFYPDAGKKQFLKISRELIDIKAGNKVDEFPLAVEKCRRYILGYNPLCIVITRLDSRYSDSVISGVKKLRQLRGRQTRKLPVMVINVPGYEIVANHNSYDINTSIFMKLNTRPRIQQLRRLGSSVLDWNPRKENLGTALLKVMKTR